MRALHSWRLVVKKRNLVFDLDTYGLRMKQLRFMGIICALMLFLVYKITNYQHQQTEIDEKLNPFYTSKEIDASFDNLVNLPRGIIQSKTDLELKPLWSTHKSKLKANISTSHNLLAMAVGIKQKRNVNATVQKFLLEDFTVMLFHYDGNVNGWSDLEWSKDATHIVAQNQTKWWFAKRFLHPDIVSIYDYIFLWDEDLGVEHFHPGRYLRIVKKEGLEISQPALDPNSTEIHHRITIRWRSKKFHRGVWDLKKSQKCEKDSEGPPCTGFVEGMAPVFSRSAWTCAWHLIQNDLVHGWGLDMKLGYCAQGNRTEKVGIVDREYVIHLGIQTLGGESAKKGSKSEETIKRHPVDDRSEVRRQSASELDIFKERWEKAAREDNNWVDPFPEKPKRTQQSRKVKTDNNWVDPFPEKPKRTEQSRKEKTNHNWVGLLPERPKRTQQSRKDSGGHAKRRRIA